MAERTPYVPRRGGNLANLAGFSAINAPAQAFGQIAQVAGAVEASATNYFESKREETYNRSIIDANMTLLEYAAQYETQPENFDAASGAFIKGKAAEYAKHDRKSAERFMFAMQQEQRRLKIDVNKKYNAAEHERMAGETQSVIDVHTRMIGAYGASDISQLLRGMEALYAGVDKRGPDNQRVFGETQANTIKQNTVENWARILVSEKVRQLSDEELESFRHEMSEGTATMPWAAYDATEGKFIEMEQSVGALLPGENDRIINMIDAEMNSRRVKADAVHGRAREEARVSIESYLAQKRTVGANMENTPSPSKEQLDIIYGDQSEAKFEEDVLRAESEGNTYRFASKIPPDKQASERQTVAAAYWHIYDKATEDTHALIDRDPAGGMAFVDDEVRMIGEQFLKGNATPEQYVSTLDAAYRRWGVMPSKRYVMTKPLLESTIASIEAPDEKGNAPTAAVRATRIKAVAHQWGPEYRDRIMAQVFDHGQISNVYSALVDIESPGASAMLAAAIDAGPQLDKSLQSTGKEVKDIAEKIRSNGAAADFFRSVPINDYAKAQGYSEAVTLLSKQLFLNGATAGDAVKKAVEIILPYEYAGIDRIVRVPKDVYTGTVGASLTSTQLRREIEAIKPNLVIDDVFSLSGMVDSETAKKQFIDSLASNARFVTNSDETGVYIVDSVMAGGQGNVLMVRDAAGNVVPWEKKWHELQGQSQEPVGFNMGTGRFSEGYQMRSVDMSSGEYR